MREGGCDDHILSDGRLHLSPFPPAPKEQVRSIPGRIESEFAANGEMMKAAAKPASIRVKVRALSKLKTAAAP